MVAPVLNTNDDSLLDRMPVSVFRVDADGRIDYVNARAAEQMGLTPQEMLGRRCDDLGMDADLWQAWKTELTLVFSTGHPSSFEFITHVGPERLVEFRLAPQLDGTGRVESVIVAALTIDEVRRLRKSIECKDDLFRSFMDNSPTIAWLRDEENRYVFLNKTYLDRLGLKPEDRLGKRPRDVWPAEVAEAFEANDRAVMASDRPLQVLETAPGPDGVPRQWLNIKFPFVNGDNHRYVGGVGLDVTDERNAEEYRRKSEIRLAQAHEIQSLGMLAAGAAHDFNNLLTLVMGHAGIAKAKIDANSPVHDDLQAIDTAAGQMSELCQLMLTFAGKGRRESRPVNLNNLAQDTARLLRSLLPRQTSVRFELAPDLPSIFGDETQFRQIILNLLGNAAEAMGDTPGTITITTSLELPSVAMLEAAGYLPKQKPHAVLEVRDDGPGMSAEVRDRVFEPFFTTKATGKGLGLAAVAGIVRSHGGLIAIESAPHEGTAFRVLLPIQQ